MEFLHGDLIREAIEEIVSDKALRNTPLNIAVAYWGEGSIDSTRLRVRRNKSDRVRIVCDLRSGACNPRPIRELLDLGFGIRTCDGMHAKVWSCSEHAIIGSANVSVNGLGIEDAMSGRNREAAVLTHDLILAESVNSWFEELWVASDEIDGAVIKLAEENWERRTKSAANRARNDDHSKSMKSDGDRYSKISFVSQKQGDRNYGSIRFTTIQGSSKVIPYASYADAARIVLRVLSQDYTDERFLFKIQDQGHRIKSRASNEAMPMVANNENIVYEAPSAKSRNHTAKRLGNSNWWWTDDTTAKQKMDLIRSVCKIANIKLETDANSDTGF